MEKVSLPVDVRDSRKRLIDRFHCHATKKVNWKPFINNLSKSQVVVAQSFWVIFWNVSRTFSRVWRRHILVYRFGAPTWPPEINKNIWSSLFLKKLFLFTRERAYVRIDISSNTWNGCTAENQEEWLFSTRQHCYFGATRCENTEVQISVFSKWNMLREWKLVQRFTFC